MAGTSSPLDPGTLFGQALGTVEDGLGAVALPALAIGASVFVIYRAWKFARDVIELNGH